MPAPDQGESWAANRSRWPQIPLARAECVKSPKMSVQVPSVEPGAARAGARPYRTQWRIMLLVCECHRSDLTDRKDFSVPQGTRLNIGHYGVPQGTRLNIGDYDLPHLACRSSKRSVETCNAGRAGAHPYRRLWSGSVLSFLRCTSNKSNVGLSIRHVNRVFSLFSFARISRRAACPACGRIRLASSSPPPPRAASPPARSTRRPGPLPRIGARSPHPWARSGSSPSLSPTPDRPSPRPEA